MLLFAISSNMKIMKFRVSASLELVNVCLDSLRYREGIKLICHAIKLLFTGMQQYQHAIEESQTKNTDKLQEIETLKKDHLDKLWVKLKSYLESKLAWKMPDNYQNEALPRELEVGITNTSGLDSAVGNLICIIVVFFPDCPCSVHLNFNMKMCTTNTLPLFEVLVYIL